MEAYIAWISTPPTALRRSLISLRPSCRQASSGFGPAAAPGLLLGGRIPPAPAGTAGSRSLRGGSRGKARGGRPCSVVLGKHHRGDRPFPLPSDVVGDHPQLPVPGSPVAGEEPPIALAGNLIVGGHVVLADLAPVARGMSIEQSGDLVVGHGGSHGGGGHYAAKVVAHGLVGGMDREAGPAGAPHGWHQGAELRPCVPALAPAPGQAPAPDTAESKPDAAAR